MTDAFIALTIKVTSPTGDKNDAKHWAQQLSSAVSTLLQTGGRCNVWTSVYGETEQAAVTSLADYVQGLDLVPAEKLPGDLMYAITTNGCGGIMLVNPDGVVLQRTSNTGETDADFTEAVTHMLEAEEHDQYARH